MAPQVDAPVTIDDRFPIGSGKKLQRTFNDDYLSTILIMLEANRTYQPSQDVVGAALFKLSEAHALLVTTRDPNLPAVYKKHQRDSDVVAEKLWGELSRTYKIDGPNIVGAVLAQAFADVFGIPYKTWRTSLKH